MTASASDPEQQLYFDDIPLGRTFVTMGRTITEADIVGFAGLSGDFNALHVDARFAASTSFGERIAHGLLVLSIASGLTTRLPVYYGLQPSLMGITNVSCRWPNPSRIGDTIRAELTFTAAERTRSGSRGRVTQRLAAVNQDDITVLDSEWMLLVGARP
jgi:acyl dehydratase